MRIPILILNWKRLLHGEEHVADMVENVREDEDIKTITANIEENEENEDQIPKQNLEESAEDIKEDIRNDTDSTDKDGKHEEPDPDHDHDPDILIEDHHNKKKTEDEERTKEIVKTLENNPNMMENKNENDPDNPGEEITNESDNTNKMPGVTEIEADEEIDKARREISKEKNEAHRIILEEASHKSENTENDNRKTQCEMCHIKIKYSHTLNEHNKKKHQTGCEDTDMKNECNTCGKIFKTRKLHEHNATDHKCKHCNNTCFKERTLKHHINRTHKDIPDISNTSKSMPDAYKVTEYTPDAPGIADITSTAMTREWDPGGTGAANKRSSVRETDSQIVR